MSDTVLIVLIVAVVVAVVLFMFRQQLKRFLFKANKDGIEATLETRDASRRSAGPRGVSISRNVQAGKGNVIDVGRSDANVSENLQQGEDNVIRARPEPPKKK